MSSTPALKTLYGTDWILQVLVWNQMCFHDPHSVRTGVDLSTIESCMLLVNFTFQSLSEMYPSTTCSWSLYRSPFLYFGLVGGNVCTWEDESYCVVRLRGRGWGRAGVREGEWFDTVACERPESGQSVGSSGLHTKELWRGSGTAQSELEARGMLGNEDSSLLVSFQRVSSP